MPRPAVELADIFWEHGQAYRAVHALPRQQRRVMRAVEVCRTAVLGGHVESCSQCDFTRIAYNSCRNRHCPKCQNAERAKWLENRKAELLPVKYFHVVFTVPEEVARIAFNNQEAVYGILFRAASETLLTIARDPKHLGCEIGFFAILHTWGQNLLHHPRSQYPECRNHARPSLLSIPPAPWRHLTGCTQTEAGRRRGFSHRPDSEAAEDSSVDAVAGMRRDKYYGPTIFE